jgi:hypothetical protein
MKRIGLMIAAVLATGAVCAAQETAGGPVANPVTTTVKGQLTRYEKNMVDAADLMPAEKYGFKPTPEMNSFGHVVMHIAQSNNFLCSKISGQAAPEVKMADTDPKEKLVAALKPFEYCSRRLRAWTIRSWDSTLPGTQLRRGRCHVERRLVRHYGARPFTRLNGIRQWRSREKVVFAFGSRPPGLSTT